MSWNEICDKTSSDAFWGCRLPRTATADRNREPTRTDAQRMSCWLLVTGYLCRYRQKRSTKVTDVMENNPYFFCMEGIILQYVLNPLFFSPLLKVWGLITVLTTPRDAKDLNCCQGFKATPRSLDMRFYGRDLCSLIWNSESSSKSCSVLFSSAEENMPFPACCVWHI